MSEKLSIQQIRKFLKVELAQVHDWIKEGLPFHGESRKKEFDPTEVREWLVSNGYAKEANPTEEPLVASDRTTACTLLGVDWRTLSHWQNEPGWPGRPGDHSKDRNGYYPIEEIRAWVRENHPNSPVGGLVGKTSNRRKYREELERIKVEREKIALKKDAEQLVDVEEVERFLQRTHAAIVTILDQFSSKVNAALPNGMDKEQRSMIVKIAETVVLDSRSMAAELIEGDKDEEQYEIADD